MYAQASMNPRGFLIAEMPDGERPRERLESRGAEALSDAELLAILLRTGRAGRSAVDVARDLLVGFGGNLDRLAEASLGELRAVAGIGRAKAIEIKAAMSLASRLGGAGCSRNERMTGPLAVMQVMREKFVGKKQEEFHVLLLDTKHRLIVDELVTKGLLDRSQIHAREVFRTAIRESCSRIVLVHNHPSGDPTPSAPDLAATASLVAAGEVVGIEVMDHVIIGIPSAEHPLGYLSMKEEKLVIK